jgi:hypothetical protein
VPDPNLAVVLPPQDIGPAVTVEVAGAFELRNQRSFGGVFRNPSATSVTSGLM